MMVLCEDGRTSTTGRGGWGGSSVAVEQVDITLDSSPTYTGTAPFTNSYPTGILHSGGGHGGNGSGVTSGAAPPLSQGSTAAAVVVHLEGTANRVDLAAGGKIILHV